MIRRQRRGPVKIWRGSSEEDRTAVSDLGDALLRALDAADPGDAVRKWVRRKGARMSVGRFTYDLSRFDRVLVIGGGKASGEMASALEGVLDGAVTAGVVSIPDYQVRTPNCRTVSLRRASHPLPDERAVEAVKEMLALVGRPSARDMVICLISGGGSSLLTYPEAGIRLPELQRVTDELLRSGAEIREINAVRKHLSRIKGGRLARTLYPARVVSLIVSDVVGDHLDAVASGPTVPDPTTFSDAKRVLEARHIWKNAPPGVRTAIERGVDGAIEETPKEGSKFFKNVRNTLIGGNGPSCIAAASALRRRGYATRIVSTRVVGEAREVGETMAGLARGIAEESKPLKPPACVVAGGETTVTVRGKGIGGRNQELVLSAARGIDGLEGAYVASMGTDGADGPTSAAGALADGNAFARARKAGLDPVAYLRDNDSNSFFREMGGLIVTGPTGRNVNDVIVVMVRGHVPRRPLPRR